MEEKNLKLFDIALVGGPMSSSNKQYYAEDENDCIELFLGNNPDLDKTDIWVKEKK